MSIIHNKGAGFQQLKTEAVTVKKLIIISVEKKRQVINLYSCAVYHAVLSLIMT